MVFAKEYLVDLNATQAAIRAGYSPHTATKQASRLLTRPDVQAHLQEFATKRLKKIEVTADNVLAELANMGFANMMDYMTINGEGQADVDLSKLTREQAAAIQEITVDTTGGSGDGERRQVLRTKFKLANKTQNLELLGKYLKMFVDRVEVTGDNLLIERLTSGRKRVAQGS